MFQIDMRNVPNYPYKKPPPLNPLQSENLLIENLELGYLSFFGR